MPPALAFRWRCATRLGFRKGQEPPAPAAGVAAGLRLPLPMAAFLRCALLPACRSRQRSLMRAALPSRSTPSLMHSACAHRAWRRSCMGHFARVHT